MNYNCIYCHLPLSDNRQYYPCYCEECECCFRISYEGIYCISFYNIMYNGIKYGLTLEVDYNTIFLYEGANRLLTLENKYWLMPGNNENIIKKLVSLKAFL